MEFAGEFVEIMDTTLRDGEQTQGVSFNPVEKLHIAKALLQSLNVDRIEVASARISDGEKAAVKRITDWAQSAGYLERVEVLGFVDFHKSADWIREAGGKVINLLTKGSEHHCHGQLRKTLSEHLSDIKKTVAYAQQQGIKSNIYLEDWSNGYADKPEYVYEMMSGLEGQGIQNFMLPDTLGVMSPEEVKTALTDMMQRFPWATFNFHPHNDYGLGTANAIAAVQAGVRSVHCTVNCLGERAGNASISEVAVVLRDKLGVKISLDESHLGPLSELVENFSGKRIAANAPIVGEDVFTQTSGIHADGDKKGGLYENPIRPERFGRKRSYALGKMSGKASLIKNLEQLGLQLSEENLKKVLDRIVELGDHKETITMADLPFIITDVLETSQVQRMQLLHCNLSSGWSVKSTASIHVSLDNELFSTTGEGTGGYDAFMNAMEKVLDAKQIQCPKLLDYQIRIPKGGDTSALTEATITWENRGRRFKTVAVDSDQAIAAVRATMKMLNLILMNVNISPLKVAHG